MTAYRLEGRVDRRWHELSRGTTVGYRRLVRIAPTRLDAVRVTVREAVEAPLPLVLGLYAG